MTELKVLDGKHSSTTEAGAGVTREVDGSCPVTDEQGQHPNRVDGSENPESGDALLENHENGPWNKEREAEAIQEREKAG